IKDINEKVKRFNDKFVAIGSKENEQAIKEMNVKAEKPSEKRKGTIRKIKSSRSEWEIIRWRLYESTGVHILELENGIMIHMLVEQRYPLTRELMQRMLEHKLEVQKETKNALNVIRFVMKQKEDLEREEE
ncbi:hypothetical protein Tco_0035825, partial [Tanacetum coccineum]